MIPQKKEAQSNLPTQTKKPIAQVKKKPGYIETEKLSEKDFKTTFPKELIPTKKTTEIFGFVLIAAVIISFFQIPFGSFLSGNAETELNIGFPMAFFSFQFSDTDKFPLLWFPLLLDLLTYFVIAYAIDVSINVFFKFVKKENTEDKNKVKSVKPGLYGSKNKVISQ